MALNDFVSQMILLTFTILAGVATWLATRKRRNGDDDTSATTPERQVKPTIFNGYADVLRKALEKADWQQERIHALEMRNSELERQLDECRREQRPQAPAKPPARRPSSRTASHKRPTTKRD